MDCGHRITLPPMFEISTIAPKSVTTLSEIATKMPAKKTLYRPIGSLLASPPRLRSCQRSTVSCRMIAIRNPAPGIGSSTSPGAPIAYINCLIGPNHLVRKGGERSLKSPLLRIKPMSMLTQEACEQGEHTLKRSLGAVNLITLGIGAVIGAGIFTLTGQAAALHAGPAAR
jgi:hypothetical protein